MIKVLIVDDITILRNSLLFMLNEDPDLDVIGTASHGEEALEKCALLAPDVILMDLKMPICDGVEATKKIRQKYSDVKILILTTFKEEADVAAALKNGANGYLLKDIEPQELIAAIKNVYKGIISIHQDVFKPLGTKNSDSDDASAKFEDIITSREKDIIRLMVEGKNYKEIAKDLYISEGAIRNIISELLRKLELKDRIQLAVFAVKNKII